MHVKPGTETWHTNVYHANKLSVNAKLSIGKLYEINMHQVRTIYLHHKLTQNFTNHRQKKAKNIDLSRNKYTKIFSLQFDNKIYRTPEEKTAFCEHWLVSLDFRISLKREQLLCKILHEKYLHEAVAGPSLPPCTVAGRIGKITDTASAKITAKVAQLHDSWLTNRIFACCDILLF